MSQRISDGPAPASNYHRESSWDKAMPKQTATDGGSMAENKENAPEMRTVASDPSQQQKNENQRAVDGSDSIGNLSGVVNRIEKVERQNRWMRVAVVALLLLVGYLTFDKFVPADVIVRQTLMESEELKLVDKTGRTRFFLRMYSRVPVLQLMDTGGKPRMSMGLRFDDTPFIDLSDKSGRTRATFEMTEADAPALKLFNENGETTFTVQ